MCIRDSCKGLSNQEIADQLHLSIETTKHCVTGLLRKLDAKSRTQAVLIAFQRNLVDPPLPIPRCPPRPEVTRSLPRRPDAQVALTQPLNPR